MKLIFTIAYRNLWRHKGKTLVIGTILFIGALIMTIGSGIIAGMNEGLQRSIVESFTGHLVIIAEDQQSDDILLSMNGATAEPINNYLDIEKAIRPLPYIDKILPGGIGYVWILNESGQPIDQYILGIDYTRYRKFFGDNLEVVEGRLLQDHERGVMVPTTIRKWIYDFCNFWLIPEGTTLNKENLSDKAKKNLDRLDVRSSFVMMGLSRKNSTLDILGHVKGIVKFKSLNSILGFYSLLDIESFRECMGYFTAEDSAADIPAEQTSILDSTDIDSLFSTSFDQAPVEDDLDINKSLFRVKKTSRTVTNVDEGTYNLIYVKLTEGTSIDRALKELNTFLKKEKLGVRVVKWNKAIGMMGQMSTIMQFALMFFVAIIFFVAFIIIMNTLSMAAMERITELGMMRAVGARKAFVSKMFLAETFTLSFIFGGIGIITGSIIIMILAGLNLTTTNEMMQIFYGGNSFHPIINLQIIELCLFLLLAVTLMSVIYPLFVARKISALDAISRD